MAQRSPPALIVTGPTACGKSGHALRLALTMHAKGLPCEIISVDSALVYRGMDIGTAKPTPEERAQVPHHLIDVCDPSEPYSAARFVRDAQDCMTDVASRGARALLVGGTMMYLKALHDGLATMPPADARVRRALEDDAQRVGWPAMHERLRHVDPSTAERLAPNDRQRIQRALEVWEISGRTMTSWHAAQSNAGTAVTAMQAISLPVISLEPDERSWLHQRIEQRFDAMLEQGFIDEVRALRARSDLHAELPSMRCVGYRQAWLALDRAHDRPLSHSDLMQLRAQGAAATRQLAKRQHTWLRSMPSRTIVRCDRTSDDVFTDVLQVAQATLVH